MCSTNHCIMPASNTNETNIESFKEFFISDWTPSLMKYKYMKFEGVVAEVRMYIPIECRSIDYSLVLPGCTLPYTQLFGQSVGQLHNHCPVQT